MTNEEWLKSLPTEEFEKYVDFRNIYIPIELVEESEDVEHVNIEWLKQERKI